MSESDAASVERRLALSATSSLSDLQNNNSAASPLQSASVDNVLETAIVTDTSRDHDTYPENAIGGPGFQSQAHNTNASLPTKDFSDLTVSDVSDHSYQMGIPTNRSNNNNVAELDSILNQESAESNSLVGMYLEVREENGNAGNSDLSIGVTGVPKRKESKIPKVADKTGNRVVQPERNPGTLSAAARTKIPPKRNTAERTRPKNRSLDNRCKPKIPTSKPRPINYYPARVYAAAEEAKANIAKMMKSVDDAFVPTLDADISTYIQNVSDVSDAVQNPGREDSCSDSEADDVPQQSDKTESSRTHEDHQDSSIHYDKSMTSSLDGYETPGAGMVVSDSNLVVSSNPGTGTPSDVDDDEEEETSHPVVSSTSQSVEQLLGSRPNEERVSGSGDQRGDDADSDSSLEPGMQRAKLFVAINQGKIFSSFGDLSSKFRILCSTIIVGTLTAARS